MHIALCMGSFYEVRVTGGDGNVGIYRVPLQPYRTDARGDQGMLVINLCSASIGFLHQVSRVGAGQHVSYTADILCAANTVGPNANFTLLQASELCDRVGDLAACVVANVGAPAPTSLEVGAAQSAPVAPTPEAPPNAPLATTAQPPSPPASPDFAAMDMDITPCNLYARPRSVRWELEHAVTKVPIPLLLPVPDPAPPLISDIDATIPPDGNRRSTRLRAKEQPDRETVAEASIRIKKAKLDNAKPLATASAPPTAPTMDYALPPAPPASAAPAGQMVPPPAPAWRVEDLQLLGRACAVPEEKLGAMESLPAPRVDNVDE